MHLCRSLGEVALRGGAGSAVFVLMVFRLSGLGTGSTARRRGGLVGRHRAACG